MLAGPSGTSGGLAAFTGGVGAVCRLLAGRLAGGGRRLAGRMPGTGFLSQFFFWDFTIVLRRNLQLLRPLHNGGARRNLQLLRPLHNGGAYDYVFGTLAGRSGYIYCPRQRD